MAGFKSVSNKIIRKAIQGYTKRGGVNYEKKRFVLMEVP